MAPAPGIPVQTFRRILAANLHGNTLDTIAHQLAASGQYTSFEGARRRLYDIMEPGRRPSRSHPSGRVPDTDAVVPFRTADKILTGLDLSFLWQTEDELLAVSA